MFKLWFLIQELIRFSRDARVFLDKSEQLIEQEACEAAGTTDVLRQSYRRILMYAALYPVVCGLIVPVVVPCIVFYTGEFWDGALAVSLLMGMIFTVLPCFFYLFAGVALGCLLAPDEFLESSAGKQWLKLIGTKNPATARVVCFVAAVVGLVIMGGVCAIEIMFLHSPGRTS